MGIVAQSGRELRTFNPLDVSLIIGSNPIGPTNLCGPNPARPTNHEKCQAQTDTYRAKNIKKASVVESW